MYQGSTKKFNIFVYDKRNGSRVTLSTAQAIKWQLFPEDALDANPIVAKELLGGGISILTDSGGDYMQIPIDSVDTVNLSGIYYYEAEIIDVLGDFFTVDSGTIEIHKRYIKTFFATPVNLISPTMSVPVLGVA